MEKDLVNNIFDYLVQEGGASKYDKNRFINELSKNNPIRGYRFRGKLGLGGKYLWKTNSVSYYKEDKTKVREELVNTLNEGLNQIKKEYESNKKNRENIKR